jgi:hypothetical protein
MFMALNSIEKALPTVIGVVGTALTVSQIMTQGVVVSTAGVVAGVAAAFFLMAVPHFVGGYRPDGHTPQIYYTNAVVAGVLGVLIPLEQKFGWLPRVLNIARPVFFGNLFFISFQAGITATIAVMHSLGHLPALAKEGGVA